MDKIIIIIDLIMLIKKFLMTFHNDEQYDRKD